MTRLKTLSAVIILSAAVATPVFAQDAGVLQPGPTYHVRTHDRSNYRGAYAQSNAPSYAAPLSGEENRNLEAFGWSGRDASRPGGMFPYFNGGSGS
jgi:hypothetical protein